MRALTLIALALVSLIVKAETFTIEGVNYTTNGYECKVTGHTADLPENVTIPVSVTYNDIEYTVTGIGQYAFRNNKTVKSIDIPAPVTEIEYSAFSGCSSLESVNLPTTLKTLGSSCFDQCEALKEITLPEGFTSTGRFCFNKCSNLVSIKLPSTLISLGDYCFYCCTSLKEINIPEGVTQLGDVIFGDCQSLFSVTLPSTLTSIGWTCFNHCYSLNDIILPKNLTQLSERLFEGCHSLTSINIPEKVKNIPNRCFSGCYALENIQLPDCLESLGYESFINCKSLKSITLPISVNNIEGYCFRDCTSLESIKLPPNLNKIKGGSFNTCSSLTHIDIPDGVTEIEANAFNGCTSLVSISLPTSLKTIGYDCFRDCSSLPRIEIPDGVTSIGGSAFYGCSTLESVSLPPYLNIVPNSCFAYCSKLKQIVIPDAVNSIEGSAFAHCSELENFSLPPSLNIVPNSCFAYCSKLKQIVIPDAVSGIKNCAFMYCTELASVTIGRKVAQIEWGAFVECTNLKSVTCRNLLPPERVASSFFSDATFQAATLHIDKSCEHLYKEDDYWSKFAHIEPVDFGYTTTFDPAEWETIKRLDNELQTAGFTGKWHTEVGPNIATQISGLTIEDDHVVGVNLPNSCVSPEALATIMRFPMARTINASNNGLTGDIATLIDRGVTNSNLTNLDISHNSISGNLAWVNDRFPALEVLTANNNHFNQIDPYINAQSLNYSNQTILQPVYWTLGPVKKELITNQLPNIISYNHSNKSFSDINYFDIKEAANKITINVWTTGDMYTAAPECFLGHYYYTIFKIGETYNQHITYQGHTVPVIFDFVPGDCNCDAVCDITDVQSFVNYVLGLHKETQLFNEQVVNFDGNETLNVLDIIGLVNHLLSLDEPQVRAMAPALNAEAESHAEMRLEDGAVLLDTDRPISAIDFKLLAAEGFTLSPALREAGFTCATKRKGNAERVIIYSASGASMPQGLTALGSAKAGGISGGQGSTPEGERLSISAGLDTSSTPKVEASAALTIGDRTIEVPARYAGGQWTAYDAAGRLIGSGRIGSDAPALQSIRIIVINCDGEEPYTLKISL